MENRALISHEFIGHLLREYGHWAVFVIVGLESLGIPLPGELVVIGAATWAGSHGESVLLVIIAAAAGAILGDNGGYWIGREFGYPLLLRFGGRLGVTQSHLKLGHYLFEKYGAFVVFFGRFVAVLRVLAAFLAGANKLSWEKFLAANAAGGIIWATVVSLAAYWFGQSLRHMHGPLSVLGLIAAIGGTIVLWLFFKRHEQQLIAEAERTYPGPLDGYRGGKD